MSDPFDSSPPVGALSGLAIPRGRFVGSSGSPLFRVVFQDGDGRKSIQLTESATKESARAWAQRVCAQRAVTVVSVGRWLGGPIPSAHVSNEEARRNACSRLVNALLE